MPTDTEPLTHPVQVHLRPHEAPQCPAVVTLCAYEVYKALFGEQQAMITGGCRGGFGAKELIAFLYARSFPKQEWEQRVDEALNGMRNF